MNLIIELTSRTGDFIEMKLTDGDAKKEVYSSLGYLVMNIKQYLIFERALIRADAEMGEDFAVTPRMPSFRKEREKGL